MLIIGGIYGGIFTATEAAAVCVVSATLIGFAQKKLDWAGLWAAVKETCVQTSAIFLIAAGIVLLRRADWRRGHHRGLQSDAQMSLVVLMLCIALIYLLWACSLIPSASWC